MTLLFLLFYLLIGAFAATLFDRVFYSDRRIPLVGTTGVVGALLAGFLLFTLDINGYLSGLTFGLTGSLLLWIATAIVGAWLLRMLVVQLGFIVRKLRGH